MKLREREPHWHCPWPASSLWAGVTGKCCLLVSTGRRANRGLPGPLRMTVLLSFCFAHAEEIRPLDELHTGMGTIGQWLRGEQPGPLHGEVYISLLTYVQAGDWNISCSVELLFIEEENTGLPPFVRWLVVGAHPVWRVFLSTAIPLVPTP